MLRNIMRNILSLRQKDDTKKVCGSYFCNENAEVCCYLVSFNLGYITDPKN